MRNAILGIASLLAMVLSRKECTEYAAFLGSYTKVRNVVRKARTPPRFNVKRLTTALMSACREHEVPILREIAKRLQREKRKKLKWGNCY